MHSALQLDEVLLNIFSHCNNRINFFIPKLPNGGIPLSIADLAALARTCRTFKEPALDLLWSELADLTPLAGCFPKACYETTQGQQTGRFVIYHHVACGPGVSEVVVQRKWYSFRRPLEQDEWDNLQSYTRRVRSIKDFGGAFRADCVRTFLSPPTSEPLFPNLRHLHLELDDDEITPLLHQPLPSLISLQCSFAVVARRTQNPSVLQESLESLPRVFTNLGQLRIKMGRSQDAFDQVVSNYVCRWSNLQILSTQHVTLNIDAVIHLSSMPNLTQLAFILGATLPGQIMQSKKLCFSRLQKLQLSCTSLTPVSKLLACIQLPAITDVNVGFKMDPSNPPKQTLSSFFAILQASGAGSSIMKLCLVQSRPSYGFAPIPRSDLVLVRDDLWPTMAFKNLRYFELNLEWNVGLTEDDLLELASAWPYLEGLCINREGWRRGLDLDRITPEGIVQLLRTCPSLSQLQVALALYHTRTSNPTRSSSVDSPDSVITPAAVPAMADFPADNVVSNRPSFSGNRRGFNAVTRGTR